MFYTTAWSVGPIRHSHGELKWNLTAKSKLDVKRVGPIRHSHGELKCKNKSNLLHRRSQRVGPIRHSHGELKYCQNALAGWLSRITGRTYSTFPRGIERDGHQRNERGNTRTVRPIRHSHGELKSDWSNITNTPSNAVGPIRHSHGELK